MPRQRTPGARALPNVNYHRVLAVVVVVDRSPVMREAPPPHTLPRPLDARVIIN